MTAPSSAFWPGMPFLAYDYWEGIDIKGFLVKQELGVSEFWSVSVQFIRDRRESTAVHEWRPVHYTDVPFLCAASRMLPLMGAKITPEELDAICTDLLRELK